MKPIKIRDRQCKPYQIVSNTESCQDGREARDMLRRLVLGGGKVRSAVGVAQSPPVPRPPANRRGPRGLDPRQIVLLLIETLALQDLHSTTFLVYFSQFCPKVLLDVVWSLGSLEACQQV